MPTSEDAAREVGGQYMGIFRTMIVYNPKQRIPPCLCSY
jgi:hypothetical protein